MRDQIERQDAIDAVLKLTYADGAYGYTDAKELVDSLEALPSAQPEPQWIPVSERLPKTDEFVLVTTDWNDISIAWRIGVDKWYIHEGNINSTTDDITAWMPLPEPYSAERRADV